MILLSGSSFHSQWIYKLPLSKKCVHNMVHYVGLSIVLLRNFYCAIVKALFSNVWHYEVFRFHNLPHPLVPFPLLLLAIVIDHHRRRRRPHYYHKKGAQRPILFLQDPQHLLNWKLGSAAIHNDNRLSRIINVDLVWGLRAWRSTLKCGNALMNIDRNSIRTHQFSDIRITAFLFGTTLDMPRNLIHGT